MLLFYLWKILMKISDSFRTILHTNDCSENNALRHFLEA